MTSTSHPSFTPVPSHPLVPFGREMRQMHFGFEAGYTPLNHGSYGAAPNAVRAAHAVLQAEVEAAPDRFIVLQWASRLRESRALTAQLLGWHDADDVVFVPNATTGLDTIFKNLAWRTGDVVLVYETVYDSVLAGLRWLEDTFEGRVRVEVVPLPAPVSDDDFVEAVVGAARRVNSNGKEERVRLAVVDTVVSMPGFRVPFERLVPALRAEGALVAVDGAHGIGHVDVDIAALDPDFFVTNLHKWLFVPRGAAALYVARRCQHLIRSSLPTSYRLRKREDGSGGGGIKGVYSFVELFDFVATLDNTNLLTVKDALKFRTEVCGGEAAIQHYCRSVARSGGAAAAAVLGTHIMDVEPDSAPSCMLDCNFVNVRLPLVISPSPTSSSGFAQLPDEVVLGMVDAQVAARVEPWIKATGVTESGCYFQVCIYRGAFWWRLSGMVYVEVEDFRRGAEVLRGLCVRVGKGEFLAQ